MPAPKSASSSCLLLRTVHSPKARLPTFLRLGRRYASFASADAASTSATSAPIHSPPPPPPSPPSPPSRSGPSLPRRFLSTTLLLTFTALGIAYYYDTRSLMHERVAMPVIRYCFDAEAGHRLAIRLLSWPKWARPRDRGEDGPELRAEIFGMPLVNPVGIAAGFDKNGDAIDGLFDLGFGYVEIGSVTPEPQPGNPQPRFFRLEEDEAAINRYGFNSLGHGHALSRLRARLVTFSQSHPEYFASPLPRSPSPPSDLPRSLRPGHILAVNLGKNKTSPADSNDDYIRGVRTLGPYADVVVVNVSSPNTPGLRALQGREILERLLRDVVGERDKIADARGLPKIAVKVACDLTEEELVDVAYAVRQSGVDGVIMSNTTVRRDGLGLQSAKQSQIGGLSGRPLFPLALNALRTLRPLLPSSIPIIGAGGISTASDALQMAQAGASIVQLYTSFGYRGVGTPRLLKDEISSSLRASGSSWEEAVGRDRKGHEGEMGWSVQRLKRESEALRKQAEELAQMLRQMGEEAEEDARHEVQRAETGVGKVPQQMGEGQARDDLLGAASPSTETPAGRIEGSQRVQVDRIEGARATPTREEAEGVAADLETVTRRGANPIVVDVDEGRYAAEHESGSRPRDGPRRLL